MDLNFPGEALVQHPYHLPVWVGGMLSSLDDERGSNESLCWWVISNATPSNMSRMPSIVLYINVGLSVHTIGS